jgi:nicotinamide-nucleotide amidase
VSARAGIVVTGTEVLTGRVSDRNGPWLSDRLLELGIELAHITICGDRPEDMAAQLRFMADQGVDLVITSGGLGPTADDLTAEVVADFTGRPMSLDADVEARIAEILKPLLARWPDLDEDAVRAANRKQAMVPDGAHVIPPAGTAPGLVVPPGEGGGPAVVVLPGPPRELHAMWWQAVEADVFQAAVGGRTEYDQRMLRLFGIPESEIAETLRLAEGEVDGFEALEVTTCLRRGEVEVVVRHEPDSAGAYEGLAELVARRHSDTLFSTDGSSVDQQVAELLGSRMVATAESCTGGLMAARLTERPGSSAYVAGGAVTYSNEAKSGLLGVDPGLIESHGAVSPQVAEAMAAGALERFEAGAAIAITGIAGPDGGSEEKPVGYVCWCARLADGARLARDIRLPGDRREVRDRSTTVGMHLLRRLLSGDR